MSTFKERIELYNRGEVAPAPVKRFSPQSPQKAIMPVQNAEFQQQFKPNPRPEEVPQPAADRSHFAAKMAVFQNQGISKSEETPKAVPKPITGGGSLAAKMAVFQSQGISKSEETPKAVPKPIIGGGGLADKMAVFQRQEIPKSEETPKAVPKPIIGGGGLTAKMAVFQCQDAPTPVEMAEPAPTPTPRKLSGRTAMFEQLPQNNPRSFGVPMSPQNSPSSVATFNQSSQIPQTPTDNDESIKLTRRTGAIAGRAAAFTMGPMGAPRPTVFNKKTIIDAEKSRGVTVIGNSSVIDAIEHVTRPVELPTRTRRSATVRRPSILANEPPVFDETE
jgi:hypothetical protein